MAGLAARHRAGALGPEGGDFEVFVCVPTTSPLRQARDLDDCIAAHLASEADVTMTIRPAGRNPYFNQVTLDKDGWARLVIPSDRELAFRQMAPPIFDLTTVAYAARPDFVMGAESVWEGKVKAVMVPEERALDIDTPLDFKIAEFLARSRRGGEAKQGAVPLDLGGHLVGPGQPCFIIAEAGVNHNGELDQALALVEAAARAGADAVKFQSFTAEEVAVEDAPKASYQQQGDDADESQVEMLRRLELSPADHRVLAERCQERGIIFLSTPFDPASADLLHELGVKAFKLPSGEVTNLPFLRHVGAKGRPVILSTGMSSLAEVKRAVETLEGAGVSQMALLHCVSAYPAPASSANLRAMETMASALGLPVGFSDHTQGIEVALAATALGACIIEKHFTLDRSLPGPDHKASLEPHELSALVRGVRRVEAALGHGRKELMPEERDVMKAARRSLVAARDIPAGTVISQEMLTLRRPGTGLGHEHLAQVTGRKARERIAAGTLVTLEMLA